MFNCKNRALTLFGIKQLSAAYRTYTLHIDEFWHMRSNKLLVAFFSVSWDIDATVFFPAMCTGCDDWVHRKDKHDMWLTRKPNNRVTTNPIIYKHAAPE